MSNNFTAILIESSYIRRSGVEELLKELQRVNLTEVYDGSEKNLHQKINAVKPDCIILNPEVLIVSLNTFVLSLSQKITVIGLVSEKTPDHIKSRFAYYLNVNDGKHELMNTISNIIGLRQSSKKPLSKNQPLTEREITILKQITMGLTNQEIAEKLFLSIHTVMTHRKNITKKLGIKTVSGLTVYALLNKIIEIQEIEQ